MKNFRNLIAIAMLISGPMANAVILWAGGEDVDFPNGGSVCTDSGFRAGYARTSVKACVSTAMAISNSFSAGPVTSLWLSAHLYVYANSVKHVGLTKSGTNSSLWVGTSSTVDNKIALWKYDGTTFTQLATESGVSFTNFSAGRIDMQIINYGASATVNIYKSGAVSPILTYTGNVLAGTATDLDRVILRGDGNNAASEIIVSDSDTRKLSLVTLAPNAAGDLNQWAGAFTDVNTVAPDDATIVTTTTSGNIFQANLSGMPAGTFNVLAVKVSARTTQTGAGITSLSLGVKTNTANSVPAAVPLSVAWGTTETYYSTNPVTVAPWTSTEINALQVHLQAAP